MGYLTFSKAVQTKASATERTFVRSLVRCRRRLFISIASARAGSELCVYMRVRVVFFCGRGIFLFFIAFLERERESAVEKWECFDLVGNRWAKSERSFFL